MRLSPSYARAAVYARDRGICYHCRIDGGLLDRILRWVRTDEIEGEETALIALEAVGFGRRKRLLSTWQMDHRHAVAEGGADCGLGNYRTLCLNCHTRVTRELHQRLQAARQGG